MDLQIKIRNKIIVSIEFMFLMDLMHCQMSSSQQVSLHRGRAIGGLDTQKWGKVVKGTLGTTLILSMYHGVESLRFQVPMRAVDTSSGLFVLRRLFNAFVGRAIASVIITGIVSLPASGRWRVCRRRDRETGTDGAVPSLIVA